MNTSFLGYLEVFELSAACVVGELFSCPKNLFRKTKEKINTIAQVNKQPKFYIAHSVVKSPS